MRSIKMKKYWYVFSDVVDSVKMTCTAVTGRDKRSLKDEKTHRKIEGVFGVRRSKATEEKDNKEEGKGREDTTT
jgi:hypothetical protein